MQRGGDQGRANRQTRRGTLLRLIDHDLLRAFGPQGWWPADHSFEMMVGAILTQATNWRNVERAIERLKRLNVLAPRRLLALPRERLARAIRPAGYFQQKAARLQAFSRWYVRCYGGSPARMFRVPWRLLRDELLQQHGVGPETADSILLYAGAQPVFVVDAYTIRVFRRHGLITASATYETVQHLVMQDMPASASRYNEFHALLVAVGKRFCHRQHPACEHCPLEALPHTRVAM